MIPKAPAIKGNIDKLDFIRTPIFTLRQVVKRMKRQATVCYGYGRKHFKPPVTVWM